MDSLAKQMISSLTFNQENTIADEPMVDLLKYLNNMLEGAVVNSRLPSGHNPLQQLVLIIADGRFHEKKVRTLCIFNFSQVWNYHFIFLTHIIFVWNCIIIGKTEKVRKRVVE